MSESNSLGRILIADDEQVFGRPLAELFSREGYEVEWVSHATAAQERLVARQFDLLISDIAMPGNAELEFVRAVAEKAPDLPVILLTGYPSVTTAVGAVHLALAAYLVKPPDFDHLLGLARRCIVNHQARRQIRLQNEQLRLRLKELEQLEHALRRPPGSPGAAGAGDFVAIAATNLQQALHEFVGLTELMARVEQSSDSRQKTNVLRALQKTVDVLEKTRRNFKCIELRDLRIELEDLLRRSGLSESRPEPAAAHLNN